MVYTDNKFDKINLRFIFFGFILSQKISFIGQIYFLEIFSILYLILNFTSIKFNSLLKKLSLVLFFHLIVVIYSDYINQSSIDLFLKGFFSLPVFFAPFLLIILLIILIHFFLVILGNGVLVFLFYV